MKKINYLPSIDGNEMRLAEVHKILECIKNGQWVKKIEPIRDAFANKKIDQANKLKLALPAFTISATFTNRRKKENVESYTGLLHLDYDKVDNVGFLKENIVGIPYTYSAFFSPSGRGLKVLVQTNAELINHSDAFNALRSYYDNIVGVESDKTVKDITRLCFISYDPELYLNENAKVFNYQIQHKNKSSITRTVDVDWVWDFTSQKADFVEGNRNSFTHLFACNANRYGLNINDVIQYASNYSSNTFSLEEIESTVNSAYNNNSSENGSYTKTSKPAETIETEIENPFVPDNVYQSLPNTLKDACNVFAGRERDVFLTTALSIISGGLYNVSGFYANEVVFPNLFSFVVAPPASGKGSMKYAKQLGDCFHDSLLKKSKDDLQLYLKEKKLFDRRLRKAKSDHEIEQLVEPIMPKKNIFYIPANTSSSMLIKHLEDNDGIGCICETEADTVAIALSKEWGGYSDILRKGFQSEVISKSRITDLEYCEIKEPKFSFAITGTPNQLDNLIRSIQDGLFSRFLFYSFTSTPEWRDTYTLHISKNKKVLFEKFSSELCDKFKNIEKQVFFMSESQGKELDRRFSIALSHNVALYNNNVTGVTFRLGLMCFKIAMVLTALRSDEVEIFCSDEDFETAMCLVEKVYMPHNINMLNKYDNSNRPLTEIEQRLLDWMPTDKTFKRAEILEEALKLGISDRTLSDMLKKFTKLRRISKIKAGVYNLEQRVAL